MIFEYDAITAKHYAAYRPALHEAILNKCIRTTDHFSLGIDIGCGTGHSSIALSKFCKKVIGIDPSKSMIENALVHSRVEYQTLNNTVLDFESNIADIITFAGSLHYAKSQRLLDEVIRLTKNSGLIVVYDFEILLEDLLNDLGFESKGGESYDHKADFSGLSTSLIELTTEGKEVYKLKIEPVNLMHLILSVKNHYLFFDKQLEKHNLQTKLSGLLQEIGDSKAFNVGANLYYKVFMVSK